MRSIGLTDSHVEILRYFQLYWRLKNLITCRSVSRFKEKSLKNQKFASLSIEKKMLKIRVILFNLKMVNWIKVEFSFY